MKLSILACCWFIAMRLLAETPQQFVYFAAQNDMLEAHLAQLAEKKGGSHAVKDLAKMLETAHTADYGRLSAIAAKQDLTIPTFLDARHAALARQLDGLKGVLFDRRYVELTVAGHEEAAFAYRREASQNHSLHLRKYASETLPALRDHLDAAKTVERGLFR